MQKGLWRTANVTHEYIVNMQQNISSSQRTRPTSGDINVPCQSSRHRKLVCFETCKLVTRPHKNSKNSHTWQRKRVRNADGTDRRRVPNLGPVLRYHATQVRREGVNNVPCGVRCSTAKATHLVSFVDRELHLLRGSKTPAQEWGQNGPFREQARQLSFRLQ